MCKLGVLKMPKDLQVGSVHQSYSYGKFEITSYRSCHDIRVRFIETGFVFKTRSGNIRSGNVRDKLSPRTHGVGFLGNGEHLSRVLGENTKGYATWLNMMARAYSESYHLKGHTYKNCTVTKEWHNYQNFAPWFKENYREGLVLDKDALQKGVAHKVYSPETCKFITPLENLQLASCKEYRLRSPKGELTLVRNMSEFCRNNPKISRDGMSQVASGRQKQHHGWTLWVES